MWIKHGNLERQNQVQELKWNVDPRLSKADFK